MNQRRNKRGKKKFLETNKNGNATFQKLWVAAKAVLKGKFTVINADIEKQDRSQVNKLTLCLKELEKEQTKLEVGEERK